MPLRAVVSDLLGTPIDDTPPANDDELSA